MKILHLYNLHRGGGGSDNALLQMIQLQKSNGITTLEYSKHSNDLVGNLSGKFKAFASPLYPRGEMKRLRTFLRQTRPDAVHAHELYPLISPWALREVRSLGIPVVFTCYDFRLSCPIATHFTKEKVCHQCDAKGVSQVVVNNCRQNIFESVAFGCRAKIAEAFRLFQKNITRYVVLNAFGRSWLKDRFSIPESRIDIVPCVVPSSASPVNAAKGGYIGYAGRFAAEKGVDLLLEASKGIGEKFLLAGYEDKLPAYERENLAVLKTNSREDLINFYRGAKVLVVPSRWYETFCLVAAEAMAEGVPVICSDIGALKYTVKDGQTGLHFKAGCVADLRTKLKKYLSDPEGIQRMSVGAHEHVVNSFSEGQVFNRILSTYQSAIITQQQDINGFKPQHSINHSHEALR